MKNAKDSSLYKGNPALLESGKIAPFDDQKISDNPKNDLSILSGVSLSLGADRQEPKRQA